jgi:MraZ protein
LSFTGEYRHTIDTKGRLIVPSRLRDELENDMVVLTIWPEGCVSFWSGEGWRELEARLLEQRRSDSANRSTIRNIAAKAHTDHVDKQGRIGVPQHLRDFAGVTRDVVVIGALDHGEIWSPDRWDPEQAKVGEGGLDQLFEQLNL